MDERIIEALENLGMTTQARYELDARTSLQAEGSEDNTVVARIGKQTITEDHINTALDALPEWMREQYKSDEARERYIHEYVTQEVLYNKAKRLGLDKTSEVRDAMAQVQKQLVVQALLEKEVGGKIALTPHDVELFYKAHKEEYSVPEARKVSYVKVEGEDADGARQKLNDGEGTAVDQWLTGDATSIGTLQKAQAAIKTIQTKDRGETTDPLPIGEDMYMFKITEKRDPRQKSFEEVKSQVEREVMLDKQQQLLGTLIEKTLEEQEVEIYRTEK
jgi:parvulin-like peptidyl-prolyl isomerase